jgi:hypothetical protein
MYMNMKELVGKKTVGLKKLALRTVQRYNSG